jgi:zinc protease
MRTARFERCPSLLSFTLRNPPRGFPWETKFNVTSATFRPLRRFGADESRIFTVLIKQLTMTLKTTILSATMALSAVTAAAQSAPKGYTFVRELGGVREYKLDSNGLTVLLLEDHSAPVLTFMVTYLVGSRNEVTGTTGATHILEHLMFKGTEKFDKAKGKGMDALLDNRGAVLNATTWLDRTNYYENLPSEHLELVVDIESDRMRNIKVRESDRKPEMTVVRNEFERGENNPIGSLSKAIWASAIVAHPYHHSTIGWRSDIENVPIERLQEFYDTFYWPNNAVVTVIGDFTQDNALNLINQYFGVHPASPHTIPAMYTEEPKQLGAKRVIVKRGGQLGVVGVGYHVPEGKHQDSFALSVLNQILTGGKTARLYKALVDKGLATSASASYRPFRDKSLFITYANLAPGSKHEDVEKVMLEAFDDVRKNGVTDEEVARAISNITARESFSRDGSFSVASVLNEWIAMGDWTYYVTFADNIRKVTAADVKRVMETYFVEDQSTTGWFVPTSSGAGARPVKAASRSEEAGFDGKVYYNSPDDYRPEPDGVAAEAAAPAEAISVSKNVKETKIGKMRLFTMKTGVKDVVTIQGSFAAGDVFAPADNSVLATVVASMLDKGTQAKDKFAIAAELENLGANLNFSADAHSLNFSGRMLKKDVPAVIALLAEQLQKPGFSQEELDKIKKQLEGAFRRQLDSPDFMSGDELSRLVYPAGHPNYGTPVQTALEEIKKITVDDLKKFHAAHYGPESMLVVATGDVDDKVLAAEFKKQFGAWKGGVAYKKAAVAKKTAALVKEVPMEDKTSVSIVFGTALGINNLHPDYQALRVATFALGGNFSARLMSTVRDKEGLTYGIYSNLSGASLADGHWELSATFAPELLDRGIEASKEQLNKWVNEGLTQEELDNKKTTLTGQYKVRMATSGGMAGIILSTVRDGRPLKYVDDYVAEINALTLDKVNGAIKTYVKPENLVLVKAGTFKKN